MCGLSAIFTQTGYKGEEIKKLNDAIRHRGPDDEGYYFFLDELPVFAYGDDTSKDATDELELTDSISVNNRMYRAMMGHRRLSILDTSWHGHQPMLSTCREYTIIYNGEVYNSDEIKKKLEVLGYNFTSNSDTEVVLNAFIKWGEKCLEKFNGMFSFIVFNHKTEKVFIARDRYGVKPLYYYYINADCISFASEIKQFTKLEAWEARLNRARAIDYLNWGQTDHTNETLFENVLQVPAGHYCEFSISSIPEQLTFISWYSVDCKIGNLSFDEAGTNFRNLFKKAVKYRLKADVPIGSCLSGGLDSSSIVCIVNKIIEPSQSQITFSSCSSDKEFDETEYIDAVLEMCDNVESHKIEIEHDKFWDEISDVIYHHDEPFLSPSVYAQWCIFKEVSSTDVKVTLDGNGADEILYGYYTFFGAYLSGLIRKFRFIEYFKAILGIRQLHGWSMYKLIAISIRSFVPDYIKDYLLKVLNRPTRKVDWINSEALNGQNISDIGMTDKFAVEVSLEQLLRFSIPKQLKWCDRDSMAHSIEARIPFLDYNIVDFLYSLPDDFKLKRGLTKRILRYALRKDIPDKVHNRHNKMGFVTPGEKWVRNNPEKYKEKLKEAIGLAGVIFDKEKCEKRFTKMIDGEMPFHNGFWRIIFFAEWIKVYNVKI